MPVGVADCPDRGSCACVGEPVGVAQGKVLRPGVGVKAKSRELSASAEVPSRPRVQTAISSASSGSEVGIEVAVHPPFR
jgi:hypothetical protein